MIRGKEEYLEYGRKLLEGREEADSLSDRHRGHYDKNYGDWKKGEGLALDPVTRRQALRSVQSACMWAAEDAERFQQYCTRYPRVTTIRGLHTLYSREQREDLDPCVYVYRMKSLVSGEILDPQICKIGLARAGADRRIAEQSRKAAVGYEPNIEHKFKCVHPERLEKLLHKKFRDQRIEASGREWFRITPAEVNDAIAELEADCQLWREDEWVCLGRRPGNIPKKRNPAQTAAHKLYRELLPRLVVISNDPSSISALADDSGLSADEVKAGLNLLVRSGYLDSWEGRKLTPSRKFYEQWRKKRAKEESSGSSE